MASALKPVARLAILKKVAIGTRRHFYKATMLYHHEKVINCKDLLISVNINITMKRNHYIGQTSYIVHTNKLTQSIQRSIIDKVIYSNFLTYSRRSKVSNYS